MVRTQDALGYITQKDYTDNLVVRERTYLLPAGCDPKTASDRCRLTPDTLLLAIVGTTATTQTIDYAYGDPAWPERPTSITTPSILSSTGSATQNFVYDPATGAILQSSISGWTDSPARLVTRLTTTSLYDGSEAAAFDPGSFFAAWLTLSQPAGQRKSVDGPRQGASDTTTFVYYPLDPSVPPLLRGRLAAQRNAAGHIRRFAEYDAFGNVTRGVDPNGVVTSSTYDTLGRVTTTTLEGVAGCDTLLDPLCATDLTTNRDYNGAGPLTDATGEGIATVYTYDNRGRTLATSRGPSTSDLRERIEYTYDPSTGRKTAERTLARVGASWVQKRQESYAYDSSDHLTEVTHGDLTTVGYEYGPGSQLLRVRDENHSAPNTFYEYDPASRLSAVRQTLSTASGGFATTLYAYDRNGNLTAVTDPNGNITSYVYDDFGSLIRQVSPVTGQTTYEYDGAGQLTTTTDANGASTTRSYDAAGRAIASSSSRGGQTESVTWTYDTGAWGTGRLRTMTDPAGSTTYSYDRRGLLIREERTMDGSTYTTSYGYDAAGNRTKLVYPSGRIVDTIFDFAGRPLSATMGGTTIVSSAQYLPFGPLTQLVYGNGTTKNMTYDTRYRPVTNSLTGPAGLIADYHYDYDAAGNITALRDELDHAYDRTFGYDDLNRLTVADTGNALWGTGTYAYDAMGNLLSSQLGAETSTFAYAGTLPKLTSVTENAVTRSVTYDAAGNETAATTTSTYSPRNHMDTSGGFTYGYDGRGVRVATSHPSYFLDALNVTSATLYPNQSVTATVTLGGPAPPGGVVVELTSSDPAVVVPETVSIGEGATTAVFGATLEGAGEPGPVTITARYGLSRSATVTIGVAPHLTSISVSPATVAGGENTEGSVVLDGPAPAGGASVRIESDDPAAHPEATVTIAGGASTGTFDVTTVDVPSTRSVTLSASYGNTVTAALTIRPQALASLSFEPPIVASGTSTLGRVTLAEPAGVGGVVVALASANPSLASVPPSVLVPSGDSTATFSVTTQPTATSAEVIITASYSGSRSATLTLTPCLAPAAPPPALGAAETVWMDDALPPGSVPVGAPTPQWTTSQKASGAQSLTQAAFAGEVHMGFWGSSPALPVGSGESVVLYMLVNPCDPPSKLRAVWSTSDGLETGVAWGEPQSGSTYLGAVPNGGDWVRVEIPAATLHLEGRSVRDFYVYVTDGQAWLDRVGKTGEGCFPGAAPAPTLGSEAVWMDDALPTGAVAVGAPPPQWTTGQKASGAQSLTQLPTSGEVHMGFWGSSPALPVGSGESVVLYVLTSECDPPSKLRAQWVTTEGTEGGVTWGQAQTGYTHLGAVPVGGDWMRIEIPASILNLQGRSVRDFYFYVTDGQAWIDRMGTAVCTPAEVAPPTVNATETVWMEDSMPAGAVPVGAPTPQWTTSQKASGTQSLTQPPSAGEVHMGFWGSSPALPVGSDESVVLYLLVNPCDPPSKLRALWATSDGLETGVTWGESQTGYTHLGAIPTGGEWVRIEIPASTLNLEGRAVRDFYLYVTDGQAWIDRVGKTGGGCFPAAAPPPTLGSETVWMDDALPTGAVAVGAPPPQWSTTQKASGAQSLTQLPASGEVHMGFWGSSPALPVESGESVVLYILISECDPPSKLRALWATTDGLGTGVTWGESQTGYTHLGAVPAGGAWTRIEIPASTLNLEGRSVRDFYFYVTDGQAWIDRVGKGESNPFASLVPMMSSNSDVVTHTEPTLATRYSFYTPELKLLAETAAATDTTLAVVYEYVWFDGQPVAQIATATNDIAWYFDDPLGTPILQSDVSGTALWRIERAPYGQIDAWRVGQMRYQPLAFPGQEEGIESTTYNIFRWYRPSWGRYTQFDPLGNYYWPTVTNPSFFSRISNDAMAEVFWPEAAHPFSYAANNPVRNSDHRGLKTQTKGCDMIYDCIEKWFPKTKDCCSCHDQCFFKYNCSAGPAWAETAVVVASVVYGPPYIPPTSPCVGCNLYVTGCFVTALFGYAPPCPWLSNPCTFGCAPNSIYHAGKGLPPP